MARFDVDGFVSDCRGALGEAQPALAVRDLLERVLADSDGVAGVLAADEGGITPLHHAPDLTVARVVWVPGMRLYPHDHRMWAAIGIFSGREDNHFFRRQDGTLVGSGGRSVTDGEVLLMGDDVIHSVTNPLERFTGAIHVYGGDFFGTPRREWDPETLEERPWDVENTRRVFEEANAAHRAKA